MSKDRHLTTDHDLPFEVAKWILPDFLVYRVGTCHGLWRSTDTSYDILAVTNDNPGNGHFGDVMEWFEFSCRRDGKDLRVLELWNLGLLRHLIEKRGFDIESKDTLIKRF